MEINQLKFLIKLLDKENYKAPLSQIKPSTTSKAAEIKNICRHLQALDLVEITEEIAAIQITPSGEALLKLDITNLPITNQELKLIKACDSKKITPSKIKISPAATRDQLIEQLIDKGFITASDTNIKEVWLTAQGQKFLATEYEPSGGGNFILSKNMLTIYLRFLRTYLTSSKISVTTTLSQAITQDKPNDDEILATIIDLDREFVTYNYLPIFHLRNKLQPPLTRDELDQALYRLQEQDRIELSTLNEAHAYSAEEIQAGIPKPIGGRLFFIIVNEN